MKLIRTVDAAGRCSAMISPRSSRASTRMPASARGTSSSPRTSPVLLSIGKENLYVWEKHPGILHEDEAAALLYKAAAGKNIHGTAPKEGKIEADRGL